MGLFVLHRCDNPKCIRVSHLFLGTIADNNHDAKAKGRCVEPPNGTANRAKTHCKRGHEFSPENTYMKPRADGGRMRCCITCRNAVRRNGRGKNWRLGLRSSQP